MSDYSWAIGAVFGVALLTAFGLMLFDWRRDTFKEDLRNAAIALISCTAGFFVLTRLHVRHADMLFAPVVSAVAALFTKDDRPKIGVHLTVLGFTIAGMAFQNAVEAYHLQRYQWPIGLSAVAALIAIAWSIGTARKNIEPFAPPKAEVRAD